MEEEKIYTTAVLKMVGLDDDQIQEEFSEFFDCACFYPEPFANNYPTVAYISTKEVGDCVVSSETPVLAPRTDLALVSGLVRTFANTPIEER